MIRRGSIVTSAKRYDLRNEEDSNWMKHVKNDQKPSLKEVMEIYHKETKKKDKPDLFDLLNWYDRYLKSKKKASEGKWEPAPTAKDKERKEVGKDKDGNPVYTYRDKGSKSNDRPETQPEPKTDGNTQNLKNKIESISKTISDDIIQKIKSQTPKKPAISEKTNEQVKNILGNVDLLKLVHKRAGKSIDKKPHLKEYVKINAEDFGDAIIVALDNIKDKVKEDTPPRFLVDEIIKSDEHLSKAANIPDLHDDVKGIVEDTVYRFFAVDKSRKVDQPKLKSYEKSGFTTNISERVDKSFKVKVDSFVHNELAKAVGNNDVPSYVKTLYKKAMIRGQVEVAYGNGYTNEKEVNNIDNLVNRFASSESDLGVKGARIKPIIDELKGERIDLIPFSNDTIKYISSALSPAKVLSVTILSEIDKKAEVIVADDMLSLAIGKSGHNVRLAARLTGWNIDVKSEEQKRQASEQKLEAQASELEQLKGVSQKNIDLLADAGLTSLKKLAELTVDDLTTLPGIGPKTAEKIIESAKEAVSKK